MPERFDGIHEDTPEKGELNVEIASAKWRFVTPDIVEYILK